ncbi:GPR endopeptidase [Alicyclobacillus sp. SO9]|uniref:GPR endopeptidase n=1 Tax=Alicyclobacillus sp. SO9 TaxID=2665646 RepID=UPI001E575B4A|nr:GPR endopeptidase [Alicyclobacillus sp. SO9]
MMAYSKYHWFQSAHNIQNNKWREPADRLASPRLDLAVEAHELARGQRDAREFNGVTMATDTDDEDLTVTRVTVETPEGEREIGKEMGTYISLEAPKLRRHDPDLQGRVVERFADEMRKLIPADEEAPVLVVGLGNAQVTPDSLGPLAVERLFVTRHLMSMMPELAGEGYRVVSAVSPGVLGITGIETLEIVRGIVEHVKPGLVVAIDALASRSIARVNATIQVADNGIHPGSGVGNHRKGITEQTLGVPVIGIGVPTVLDAATIAGDAIEKVVQQLQQSVPGNGASEILGQLSGPEKRQMVKELLEPLGNNLMVTPKEIDEFVEDVANIIAKGLNLALHSGMSMEEANLLTH